MPSRDFFSVQKHDREVAQPQLITQDTAELVTSDSMRKQAESSKINDATSNDSGSNRDKSRIRKNLPIILKPSVCFAIINQVVIVKS